VRRSRRQRLIWIVEIAGLTLLFADLLLYFAVLRPVQTLVAIEQRRFFDLRRRLHVAELRVDRLVRSQRSLPDADDKLGAFKRDHVPSRRQAFSQAARLVSKVGEQSGIQISGVGYRLDPNRGDPLERLGIEIQAVGSYTGLLKFAHGLETASQFILIREFNFQPGDGGVLALRLVADLYLAP